MSSGGAQKEIKNRYFTRFRLFLFRGALLIQNGRHFNFDKNTDKSIFPIICEARKLTDLPDETHPDCVILIVSTQLDSVWLSSEIL